MLLVELQKPRTIVELGTHWGVSYCAFCQAVTSLGLDTRCFAVDTWTGDAHSGHYGDEIYDNLNEHHRQYESFSKLLRMTFDEARQYIPDHSVDLMHIDGLHTYDAVKWDYDSWLPKISQRGIILFHDTMVLGGEFGVYRLWAELSPSFPHFNFEHGYGLGILAVGRDQAETVLDFLRAANVHSSGIRELFSALGRRLQLMAENVQLDMEVKRLTEIGRSRAYLWRQKIVTPLRRLKRLLIPCNGWF
jgi:hypothetical protein